MHPTHVVAVLTWRRKHWYLGLVATAEIDELWSPDSCAVTIDGRVLRLRSRRSSARLVWFGKLHVYRLRLISRMQHTLRTVCPDVQFRQRQLYRTLEVVCVLVYFVSFDLASYLEYLSAIGSMTHVRCGCGNGSKGAPKPRATQGRTILDPILKATTL